MLKTTHNNITETNKMEKSDSLGSTSQAPTSNFWDPQNVDSTVKTDRCTRSTFQPKAPPASTSPHRTNKGKKPVTDKHRQYAAPSSQVDAYQQHFTLPDNAETAIKNHGLQFLSNASNAKNPLASLLLNGIRAYQVESQRKPRNDSIHQMVTFLLQEEEKKGNDQTLAVVIELLKWSERKNQPTLKELTAQVANARQGDIETQLKLGCVFFLDPYNVLNRINDSLSTLRQGMKAGNVNAKEELGRLLLNGEWCGLNDKASGQRLLQEAATERVAKQQTHGGKTAKKRVVKPPPSSSKPQGSNINEEATSHHNKSREQLAKAIVLLNGLEDHSNHILARHLLKQVASKPEIDDDLASDATFHLACMWQHGKGGKKDAVEAKTLFEKAAEVGHPQAQYRLATMLEDEGSKEGLIRARMIYEVAAFSDPIAKFFLANMLEDGKGGPKNLKRAQKLYRQLANEGDLDAMVNLALMLEGQDARQARAWYERAVKRGHHEAKFFLANMLADGKGGPKNLKRARELYEQLANQKDLKAMMCLALMLEEQDAGQARTWYERAAKQGHRKANFFLATMLKDGKGGPKNLKRAQKLYRQLANQKGLEAMMCLAVMLDEGKGGPKDEARAKELWEEIDALEKRTLEKHRLSQANEQRQAKPGKRRSTRKGKEPALKDRRPQSTLAKHQRKNKRLHHQQTASSGTSQAGKPTSHTSSWYEMDENAVGETSKQGLQFLKAAAAQENPLAKKLVQELPKVQLTTEVVQRMEGILKEAGTNGSEVAKRVCDLLKRLRETGIDAHQILKLYVEASKGNTDSQIVAGCIFLGEPQLIVDCIESKVKLGSDAPKDNTEGQKRVGSLLQYAAELGDVEAGKMLEEQQNDCKEWTAQNKQITDRQLTLELAKRPNLRQLCLANCRLITNQGLQAIAEHCPNLTDLVLEGCVQITDVGVMAIANRCPNLTFVKLGGCRGVSDRSLKILASKCKRIRTLDLRDCHQISNDGIGALANSCRDLENLSLAGCTAFNNRGRGLLAIAKFQNLQNLNLFGCRHVKDKGVTAIATSCTRLQNLIISGSEALSNKVLKAIAKHCTTLHTLHLLNCTRITDKGIKFLVKCPKLRHLNLKGCTRITPAGILRISQNGNLHDLTNPSGKEIHIDRG